MCSEDVALVGDDSQLGLAVQQRAHAFERTLDGTALAATAATDSSQRCHLSW